MPGHRAAAASAALVLLVALEARRSGLPGSALEGSLVTGSLLALAASLVAARRGLARAVPRPSGPEAAALALVLSASLVLRAWHGPSHALFGEWTARESARALLLHHRSRVCLWGTPVACDAWGSSTAPPGHAALLAFAYSLLGTSEHAARLSSLAFGTASVGLAWALASLLAPGGGRPLASALVLAALPVHVRLSSVPTEDAASLLLGGLAVLCAAATRRRPGAALGWAAAASLAAAVAVRPGNALLAAPAAAAAGPLLRRLRAQALAAALAAAPLAAGSLALPVPVDGRALAHGAWSALVAWGGGERHPSLLPLLAFLGAWRLSGRRAGGLLFCWLALMATLHSAHLALLDDPGQDRHMLLGYVPLTVLAAAGAAGLPRLLPRGSAGRWLGALALAALTLASLAQLAGCSGPSCTGGAERVLSFAVRAGGVRPDCVVVAPTPELVTSEWGRAAASAERLDAVEAHLADGGCALFYDGGLCDMASAPAAVPGRADPCAEYGRRFEVEPVIEDLGGRPRLALSLVRARGRAS